MPNATLASTAVENLSWYDDRRGRFAFLLCPNQSSKILADARHIVAEAFKQPAVADWQQYLQFAPISGTVSGACVGSKVSEDTEGEAGTTVQTVRADAAVQTKQLQRAAKAAGPTQLWDCGFVEVDRAGALVFEVIFCVPHSDVVAFKRVRHEAFVAVIRALEHAGVRHSSAHQHFGSP